MDVSELDRFVQRLQAPAFGSMSPENSPDATRLSNPLGGYTASL